MNNTKKETNQPKSQEDGIHAQIADKNEKNPKLIDAVRTGDEKEARYHNMPYDEQMYGSFADIRKQRGEAPDENEEAAED